MKSIITISRQFGSGGREIGEKTAAELGYKFYDKEIIEKLAEKTGLAKEYIRKAGEYAPSKSIFSYAFIARNSDGTSITDYLYRVQRELVLEIAEEGPCVIVGRCADYILREHEGCLNVFIRGELDAKIERVTKLYSVNPDKAKKIMKDADKKRAINYKYCAEREWGAIKNYDMVLNSTAFGIEKCVDLICRAAK